jgi:hypothetical protein
MNNATLTTEDARAIVRLLGEVAILPDGHTGKKRHLMEGLPNFPHAAGWCTNFCSRVSSAMKSPGISGFLCIP